jgi:hypothetical protein
MTIEAAHRGRCIVTLPPAEANLILRRAPAVADTASAAAVRRAGELLHVLSQQLFEGLDPSGQTGSLK